MEKESSKVILAHHAPQFPEVEEWNKSAKDDDRASQQVVDRYVVKRSTEIFSMNQGPAVRYDGVPLSPLVQAAKRTSMSTKAEPAIAPPDFLAVLNNVVLARPKIHRKKQANAAHNYHRAQLERPLGSSQIRDFSRVIAGLLSKSRWVLRRPLELAQSRKLSAEPGTERKPPDRAGPTWGVNSLCRRPEKHTMCTS